MDESATEPPIRVCHANDLAGGSAVVAKVDGTSVAVFPHDGDVYAIENVCPHQGGPVGEGKIEDGCIHCPWHGWQFDLDTGEHVHGQGALNVFPVKVKDEVVYVSI